MNIEEKEIVVSEMEINWNQQMNNELKGIVSIQAELFNNSIQETWGNVRLEKEAFKVEITDKLYSFINEISSVNYNLLKSKIFGEQIRYLYNNGININFN